MKTFRAIAIGVLLVLIGHNVALGESASGPTTVLKSTFPVTDPPSQFQLVQQVLDFPAGAWTAPHSHGGPAFVTIGLGTVTQLNDGKETTYKVGETWTETPGHAHQAGNTASEPARTLVNFLLPPGAEQTTPQQMANAHAATIKTIARKSQFEVPAVARPFDLVQMQLNFAPGQQLPSHTYGGPAFIMVLDGELTLRAKGVEKNFKSGEGWTEMPGEFSQVMNAGTAPASIFATILLPKGAALTILEPQVLPQTGGEFDAWPLGLALIAPLLIVGGGVLWRRNATRVR